MKQSISLVQSMAGISTKRDKDGVPYVMYSAHSPQVFKPFVQGSGLASRAFEGCGTTSSQISVHEGFFNQLLEVFSRDYKGSPIEYDFEVTINNDGRLQLIGFTSEQMKLLDKPASSFDLSSKPKL